MRSSLETGKVGKQGRPACAGHRREGHCLLMALPPAQASSIENKQDWIKHIREVIQERTVHLRGALKEPIHIPKTAPAARQKGRR